MFPPQQVPNPVQQLDPTTQSYIGTVIQCFHQQPGRPPTVFDCRSQRWLASPEQPYERRLQISGEWRPFPMVDWLEAEKIALLAIRNDEGHLQVVPTEEEREDVARRILELGVVDSAGGIVAFARILPRECAHLEPLDISRLYLRCQHQQARCTILLSPR